MSEHAYTLAFLPGGICPCLDWRCTGGDPELETEYVDRDPWSSFLLLWYRFRRWLG